MIGLRLGECERIWGLVVLLALLAGAPQGARGASQTAFVDGKGGPTCQFFNLGTRLRWPAQPGEYIGETSGSGPLSAPLRFFAADRDPMVSVDVSEIARSAATGGGRLDMVLFANGGAGLIEFHSREAKSPSERPRLVLKLANGKRLRVTASADTYLACGSHGSQGGDVRFKVGPRERALVGFDLSAAGSPIRSARLDLNVRRRYGNGEFRVGALRGLGGGDAPVVSGIADAYPLDRGLEKHPDVLFVGRFQDSDWDDDFSYLSHSSRQARVVKSDPALKFKPVDGPALRVKIPAQGQTGLDLRYGFADKHGTEPEQIYFRYYLRFSADWNPDVQGGKLPGFAGTYGKAGWGQRRSDGYNGWSARGYFPSHPKNVDPDKTPNSLGSYVYHVNQHSAYSGDAWPWGHPKSLLSNNRWYSVEQFLRLNKPGREDGELIAWVDGVKVFEKKGLVFRHTDKLRIETIWMNVFHGGMQSPGKDLHMFIDNLVIARRYIGPMKGRPTEVGSR